MRQKSRSRGRRISHKLKKYWGGSIFSPPPPPKNTNDAEKHQMCRFLSTISNIWGITPDHYNVEGAPSADLFLPLGDPPNIIDPPAAVLWSLDFTEKAISCRGIPNPENNSAATDDLTVHENSRVWFHDDNLYSPISVVVENKYKCKYNNKHEATQNNEHVIGA